MASPPDNGVTDREQLLDEVLASYLRLVKEGQAPGRQELLARHPELAPELSAFFADRDRFDRLAAPLRQAVAPDARLPAGSTLGHYDLLEEIGHGGMGVIYKARQRPVNRIVALKMLRVGPHATAADLQRFRTEADAVARLDHPHIVPIYEVGEHQGQPYFTMRLMEGGSLAQESGVRSQESGISVERQRWAARLVETVARAVHYAHQRGILHRDLKPANILLDADGEPHVTDFGLAKIMVGATGDGADREPTPTGPLGPDSLATGPWRLSTDAGPTQAGSILGTPSYMAPEQASGQKELVTTAADVYSLGAVLYELLTGRPPFEATTPQETVCRLLDEKPERPRTLRPGVDRDLEVICLKCLEKDPRQRYAGALALADDLQRFREGRPIQARPVGALERTWRWCRRQPAAAAAVGLAALVVVTLTVGSVLFAVTEARYAARLDQAARELAHEQEQTQAALQESRLQSERAQQQQARAEGSFHLAHQAVNDFCVRLDEQLDDVPGLQPFRRKLLEGALAYYQAFLKDRGEDDQLRLEQAEAHRRIGRITGVIGTRPEALAACQKSLELFEALLRSNPKSQLFQRRVVKMYHEVGRHQPTHAAGLAWFEKGRDLGEQLLPQSLDDVDLRIDLADNYNGLAVAYRHTGRVADAQKAFARARDLVEELVRRQPTRAALKRTLALYVNNIGVLQNELGQRDEALRSFERALDLRRQLTRDHPRVSSYKLDEAASLRDIGMLQINTGWKKEALTSFQDALQIREQLWRESPSMIPYQNDLAKSCQDVGHALKLLGRLDEALTALERARSLAAKLAQFNPTVPEYQVSLARCLQEMGDVLRREQRREEALRPYQQARDLVDKLVRDHPETLDFRWELGRALNNLAVALRELGRLAEAEVAVRQALAHNRAAFEKAPTMTYYRTSLSYSYYNLAIALRQTGRIAEAVAMTRERQKLWPTDAHELWVAAVEYAKAANGIGQGQPELSADEQSQRRGYDDLALEALRQAIAAGFQDADALRKEASLERLRQRADFTALTQPLLRR